MATVIPFSQKPLVKAHVVAAHLDCCEATILRMARTGKIPAKSIRNGARILWRFDLDQVVAALETQTAQAG